MTIRCFMCVFVTIKFIPKNDTYEEKRKELKHVNIKKKSTKLQWKTVRGKGSNKKKETQQNRKQLAIW